MTVTYRVGYSTQRMTLAELKGWWRFSGLHPEFQRRLICLMDHARVAGVDLGIGGGLRTVEEQFRLFDSRHDVASTGCCSYSGKRWRLVTGAHAAPPGVSYHEPTIPHAGKLWGLAVDVVGWENGWVNAPGRLDRFGLRSFVNLTGAAHEPWHLQPWTAEIPTSRSQFNPTMHTLKTFALPPVPVASTAITVPDPTIRLGSTGTEVRELQSEMRFFGWYTATIDGSCGQVTVDAIKRLQAAVKVGADGVYGSVTANAYKQWKTALAALA